MNGLGRSRPRAQIEPKAQPIGAISSRIRPCGVAVRLLPALSQTTPRKPIAMPSHSPRLAFCPRIAPNRAIHSGTEATAVAARPEDTVRSASTTMPLPSTSMVRPMIARLRHWRLVGAGEPRQRSTAYISEPAMMNRPPETIVSGSAPPSSASRIPR
ncbi:hypothetical protein D3C71_991350 [compost metagenome]